MAGIVIGLLGPVIELGKGICNYLCCFRSNVECLNEEANELEGVRAGLQMRIDTAESSAEVIDPEVEAWMKKVTEIQQKKTELDKEINKVQGGGFLSVKSRYSASKRAVKTVAIMKQRREDRHKITVISHPPPPASMVPDNLDGTFTEFQSRRKIEEDLMGLLKDKKVNMLGICGMGGVGKSTLALKIKSRLQKEGVFGESLLVTVSQTVDKSKIQEDIAGELGLKFDDHEKSLSSRRARLHTRLKGKRILIVLDDVWEYIDLEELGITCKSDPEGCTVLLTSRNRDVLEEMDAQQILEMETIHEEEALSFFKEKLGSYVDHQNEISTLIVEIAKECKCLPLALAIVARALKGKKNVSFWRNALEQLKSSNPENLSGVVKQVYNHLKLSYDTLNKNSQSIFLLCSLFPEDYNIPLSKLTAYAKGLHMLEETGDLEQERDSMETLVGILKSCFLLLKGRNKQYVKMHDVVRDVAIHINSNVERNIKHGYDSTWISPFVGEKIIELFKGSTFPNLRLLWIEKFGNEELDISGISFEGMKKLNVLSIRDNSSLTSLPLTTHYLLGTLILEHCTSLKTISVVGELLNLGTLILEHCTSLKTISVVGELLNLEVLICRRCDAIEEFPTAMLNWLKQLEISNCRALEKIGSAGLDRENFGDESQPITITFSKLESLRLLNLPNIKLFYQGIEKIEFPQLTQLQIKGCGPAHPIIPYFKIGRVSDSLLSMQKVSFGNLMKQLLLDGISNCGNIFSSVSQIPSGSLTHLEELTLGNCVDIDIKILFPFSIAQSLHRLRSLRIELCKEMVKVVEDEEEERSSHTTLLFPNLQEISLRELPKLKTFCNLALGFPKLVNLYITECRDLGGFNLDRLTTPTLESLESIDISYCAMMQVVFLWSEKEEGINGQNITFPKLATLRLSSLHSLTHFYKGVASIEFPLLTRINIADCPSLTSPVSATTCSSSEDINNKVSFSILRKVSLAWIQIPAGSFTHLEELTIYHCDGIKSLFSFSVAQTLNSLIKLDIWGCGDMVKVIEEAEEERSLDTTILFPRLQELTLESLAMLKTFSNFALGLSELVELRISDCLEIGGLSLGSQNMKSLESLEILGCSMMEQVFMMSELENDMEIVGQSSSRHPRHITFPKLTTLSLDGLTGLTSFYMGVESLEFPLLTKMDITSCPNLKSFVSSEDIINNKKLLMTCVATIDNVDIAINGDLNDVLRQHFISRYNNVVYQEDSTSSEENVRQEEDEEEKGKIVEEEEPTSSECQGDKDEKDEIEEEESTST